MFCWNATRKFLARMQLHGLAEEYITGLLEASKATPRRGNKGKCAKIGKVGRNSGQTDQKPEYECLNSEQTKNLAEISASPKKNENNYTYSLRNQKAGRDFGQKGVKLHIHIVVCSVTPKLASFSASFRKMSNTTH